MSVVIVEEEAVAAEQSIEAETEAKAVAIKPKAKPEPSPNSDSDSDSDSEETEIPSWIKRLKQSPAASALERLFAQQTKVRRHTLEVERRTKLAKAAKTKLEAEQDVLSQIFEELSINPDEWLPFGEDNDKDDDDAEDVEIEAETEAGAEGQRGDIEAAAWLRYRQTPIGELEAVTPKVKESLREASILFLGDLDDYLRDGNLLTNIPGIGETKAEKLLDEKVTLFQTILADVERDFAGRTNGQPAAAQD